MFRSLLVLAVLCAWQLPAQQTDSSSSDSQQSESQRDGPDDVGIDDTVPRRPLPKTVFVRGRVLMASGSLPPPDTEVQLVCAEGLPTITSLDRKGRFSLGVTVQTGGGGRLARARANPAVSLETCRVEVNLSGHRRQVRWLAQRGLGDPTYGADLGDIVLYTLDPDQGTIVSMTSLDAPRKAQAELRKARRAVDQQKLDLAEQRLRGAVALHPTYAEAWVELGDLLANAARNGEARWAFQAAFDSDPQYLPVYAGLVPLTGNEQQWEKLSELATKWARLDPSALMSHYFQAVASLNLRQFEEAEQAARRAFELPESAGRPELHRFLGDSYAGRNDWDAAVEHYRKFLQLAPSDPAAPEITRRVDAWENHEPAVAYEQVRLPPAPTIKPAIETAPTPSPLPQPLPQIEPLVVDEEARQHVIRVRETMRRRHARIPDYSCLRTVERDLENDLPGSFWNSHDSFRVEVAFVDRDELYSWPGAETFESLPLGEMVGFGVLSSGEFTAHSRAIFQTPATTIIYSGLDALDGRQIHRYQYRVPASVSEYRVNSPLGERKVAYRGAFIADALTYEVLQLEVTLDESAAELGLFSSSTTLSFEPFDITDSPIYLPSRSEARMHLTSGYKAHNVSTFSSCKAYGAESTISFDESSDPTGHVDRAAEEFYLPAGVRFTVELATALSSDATKAGDTIEGVLAEDLKAAGQTLAPRGARVLGRVRKVEQIRVRDPHFVLGIELTEIRHPAGRARIGAELRQVLKIANAQRMQSVQNRGRGVRYDNSYAKFFDLAKPQISPTVGEIALLGGRFLIEPGMVTRWRTVSAPSPARGAE